MAPREGLVGQGSRGTDARATAARSAAQQPKSKANALINDFIALSRHADPTRPPRDDPRTPTLPTRLARGGASPIVLPSSPAPSSSSGLTYQDIAPAALDAPADQPNPFALEGQAKRAADQARLLAQRQLGAPALPSFGLPPSAFSHQLLGASAAAGPSSSTLFPPVRHASFVSLDGGTSSLGVAPRSTNRQKRDLLRDLLSNGGGSGASSRDGRASDAGKENVEPAQRHRLLLAAPVPASTSALELETPKRQRTRVVEWRNDVHRAASVDELRGSSGGGAVRVDERVARRGEAAVDLAGARATSEEKGARSTQARPRGAAVGRAKGQQVGGETDGERAQPAKKPRQRRRVADKDEQGRRGSTSPGAGAAAASAPKRRSGRSKRVSGPPAAAADETGVSTLDLVAMLPRRAKRFGRSGGLSSQDEGDEDEEEDEATDYDDPGPSSKRKPKQRKPATRSRKTVSTAAPRKKTRRDESSGASDNSVSRREKEAKRRKWAEVDAYELEVRKTL
ncbi:hypothetical protein JCM9279_005587 [Rhodotorula babjevae]